MVLDESVGPVSVGGVPVGGVSDGGVSDGLDGELDGGRGVMTTGTLALVVWLVTRTVTVGTVRGVGRAVGRTGERLAGVVPAGAGRAGAVSVGASGGRSSDVGSAPANARPITEPMTAAVARPATAAGARTPRTRRGSCSCRAGLVQMISVGSSS